MRRPLVRIEQVASMGNAIATWCNGEQASPCQQGGRAVDFAALDRGVVRVVGYIGSANAIIACARGLVGARATPDQLADEKWRQGIYVVLSEDATVLHIMLVSRPDAYAHSEERSSRFDLDTVAFVRHMIRLCSLDGSALNVLIDGAQRGAHAVVRTAVV